jgi:hypothetical protein
VEMPMCVHGWSNLKQHQQCAQPNLMGVCVTGPPCCECWGTSVPYRVQMDWQMHAASGMVDTALLGCCCCCGGGAYSCCGSTRPTALLPRSMHCFVDQRSYSLLQAGLQERVSCAQGCIE